MSDTGTTMVAETPLPPQTARLSPGMVWVARRDDGLGQVVKGWVRVASPEPDALPELGVQLAGGGTRLVIFDHDAEHTLRIFDGIYRFVWTLPPDIAKTSDAILRFWRMDTGEELSGSPLALAKRDAGVPGERIPHEPLPALAVWPLGLVGEAMAGAPVEVANGVSVEIGAPAQSAQFDMIELNGADSASPPRRGVRLMAGAAVRHLTAHFHPVTLPPVGEPAEIQIQAWLPKATDPNQQAHVEVWLTRQTDSGFEQLRRLRRSRIFRRPSQVKAELLLTDEEAEEAHSLRISLLVRDASGLSVLAPELAQIPVLAEHGMEDAGLQLSFGLLAEMVRLHGEAALPHPLLPAEVYAPPRPLPARAEGAGHPPTDIIVPVYNGDLLVRDCIRSLREAATENMRVLIVDDGSRAFTLDMLAAEIGHDPRFTLRRRAENRGYTKSINEGLMLTTAPWVVILNSDTLVPKGWLERLHAAARARPGTGMAGPLSNAATWQSIPEAKARDGKWSTNDQIEPQHLEQMQALLARVSERAYPEFPVLNGFCTLIGRDVFDRIGLYDEDAFPMGYGEETDVCLRARRAGFRLTVADDTFVYHHKSVSFGSANRSRLTRAGGLEMTNKHIGANIRLLEHMMQSCQPMVRLRARMLELLAELV